MTADLSAFILARVAEDEAGNADSHNSAAWHENDCGIHPQGLEETWCDCPVPARVLAQCAALRAVVALEDDEAADSPPYYSAIQDTLRALAGIWRDHDEWREEWA